VETGAKRAPASKFVVNELMPREIPAHIWVSALLRRASVAGAFATIVHRGDEERGDVLVKVTRARGEAQLYAPAFNPEGPSEFERLAAEDELAADALIAKRLKSDRDLWVVEIEDREGRHFLTEKVR
jgi:hypothetical protein